MFDSFIGPRSDRPRTSPTARSSAVIAWKHRTVPTTVSDLVDAAGLSLAETVRWRGRVRLETPGAYVVARTSDPSALLPVQEADISLAAVNELLDARPELLLDGHRPTPELLAARLSSLWIADETVVYIGLAGTSVRSRVGAYYRTPLGARRPHSGGWFVKTLTDIDALWVHVARAADPTKAEGEMLARFCASVSRTSLERLHDAAHPFPFANLEWPRGTRKRHGITGARESGCR